MQRTLIAGILLMVLCVTPVAAEYYADVDIYVDAMGRVTISGTTNHLSLNVTGSESFTSKKDKYWLLNITLPETFSEYVYTLHLPQNSQINYIKTASLTRINDAANGIEITGVGHDKPFVIVTQYYIDHAQQSNSINSIFWVVGVIAIIIISGTIIFKFTKKREKVSYNKAALTERQLQIMNLLERSKVPVTQAYLEKELGIAKSSLSRNIASLERKGIIQKESKGMSNIVSIRQKESGSASFRSVPAK